MTGIVNSTGAKSGVIGTTVGTPVGGKVLQVVSSKTTYEQVVEGDTDYHDVEASSGVTWTVPITIASTSNHILVFLLLNILGTGGSSVPDGRGTFLVELDKGGGGYNEAFEGFRLIGHHDFGTHGIWANHAVTPSWKDSPSFEGIVTYKVSIKNGTTTSLLIMNTTGASSAEAAFTHLILMEVAG